MAYIGLKKAQLVELPLDELKKAHEELADYVDRLEQGGGTGNWATAHVGVYRGRLRSAEEALSDKKYAGADEGLTLIREDS